MMEKLYQGLSIRVKPCFLYMALLINTIADIGDPRHFEGEITEYSSIAIMFFLSDRYGDVIS